MFLRRLSWFGISACAFFSAVLTLPITPWADRVIRPFQLEVTVTAEHAGRAQLFYDCGGGLNERDSSVARYRGGGEPDRIRLPIAEAEYRELRLDPSDGAGVYVLSDLAITRLDGSVVRAIPIEALKATHQIANIAYENGAARLTVPQGNYDPMTVVTLTPPLDVEVLHAQLWRRAALVWSLLTVAAVGLLAGAQNWIERRRAGEVSPTKVTWNGKLRANPRRTILVLGVLAGVGSSYPVVFFGKSYLSPNNAVYLLYDTIPSVPGYGSTKTENVHGSDIGAVMWGHWPQSTLLHRALFVDGEWPLWNRYVFAGTPLLGQGISTFGDPLQIPAILSNGAVWAWDFHFVASRCLFAIGLGLTVFALTRSFGAAVAVTLSAPFIGFFAFRFNHPAFFSLCYAPWLLVCWIGAGRADTWRRTALWLGGLVLTNLALFNSGALKEGLMQMVVLNACGAMLVWLSEQPRRIRLQKLAAGVATGIGFILLTTPIWLTFYWTLKKSWTFYDHAFATQVPPAYGLAIFEDIFYWQLRPNEENWDPSLNFFLFVGVLWAAASARSLWASRAFRVVSLGALFCGAMVFGGIPGRWIAQVPFVANIIHIDNTFSCIALVLLAVVAGFGFRELWRDAAESRWRGRFVGMLLILAGLMWLYFGSTQDFSFSAFARRYVPLITACAVGVPLLARGWMLRPQWRAAAVVWTIAVFGLLHARHGQHLNGPFEDYVANPQGRVDLKAPSPAVEFVKSQLTEPARVVGFGMKLFPGYNQALLLEGPFGIDPLHNLHYAEVGQALGIDRITNLMGDTPEETIAQHKRGYDFLNVRFYLGELSATRPIDAGLRLAGKFDLAVFESAECWPRAFFTDAITGYEHAKDFAELIRKGDGRPFAAVQNVDLSRPDAAFASLAEKPMANRAVIPAKNYAQTTNVTTFDVRATGPGLVVLQEAFYRKDFRVTVNGRPAPCLRVNHAFKGVYVPGAGDYRVSFEYRPSDFTLALALAAIGVVGLLGGGGWAFGRREPMQVRETARAEIEVFEAAK